MGRNNGILKHMRACNYVFPFINNKWFFYIEYNLAFIKKSPIRVFYLIFNYFMTEIRSLSSLLFQRRCAHAEA